MFALAQSPVVWETSSESLSQLIGANVVYENDAVPGCCLIRGMRYTSDGNGRHGNSGDAQILGTESHATVSVGIMRLCWVCWMCCAFWHSVQFVSDLISRLSPCSARPL